MLFVHDAIETGRTGVLVLSERSVDSAWVQDEVKKVREIDEDGQRKHVLCPVALDDFGKTASGCLSLVKTRDAPV